MTNEYVTGWTNREEWPYDPIVVLWGIPYRKWFILRDGYGLGISDGWYVVRPVIYNNWRVEYDHPEALPQYVKDKFQRMVNEGLTDERLD